MKAMYGLFFVVVACVTAASARAEDIVLVSSLIPYENADTASEDVRKECNWNTTMPGYLARKSKGLVQVAEQSIDAVTGKKLMIVATSVYTTGGGRFSGPKWLTLEGKLTEEGKLLGTFQARRRTSSGSMRACGTLDSLSEDLAGDILRWLKTPSLNANLGDTRY